VSDSNHYFPAHAREAIPKAQRLPRGREDEFLQQTEQALPDEATARHRNRTAADDTAGIGAGTDGTISA
jgi:hypothetical protein